MTTYKKITTEFGLEYIEKTEEDGKIWSIPVDLSNSDYVIYLESLKK
jgi:hypothetical protein